MSMRWQVRQPLGCSAMSISITERRSWSNVGHLVADHHAVGHGQGAGGGIAALSLDFHDAHPAGGVGLHAGVVAEIGDVDAGIYGRFQHHLAGLGR